MRMQPSPVMTATGVDGRASLPPMAAGIAQPIGPRLVAEQIPSGAYDCQQWPAKARCQQEKSGKSICGTAAPAQAGTTATPSTCRKSRSNVANEAGRAVVRHGGDGGIRETQAAPALAAEGFDDAGEQVRGCYELDVAGLEEDRCHPHGDIEPSTGEEHGDHLEKDVFREKGRAPFASDQLLHGGRGAVMTSRWLW
jgi:hypothetical protein